MVSSLGYVSKKMAKPWKLSLLPNTGPGIRRCSHNGRYWSVPWVPEGQSNASVGRAREANLWSLTQEREGISKGGGGVRGAAERTQSLKAELLREQHLDLCSDMSGDKRAEWTPTEEAPSSNPGVNKFLSTF